MKKIIVTGIIVSVLVGAWIFSNEKISNHSNEIINGIAVPPDPGEAGKETLAGIDSNNNGVRDDVERKIAEDYGNDPNIHSVILDSSMKIQMLFQDVSADIQAKGLSEKQLKELEINDYKKTLRCVEKEEFQVIKGFMVMHRNTDARQEKFIELLGGTAVLPRGQDCE